MSRLNIELAPEPVLTPGDKLRVAIDLANVGIAMKRAALRS